MLAHHSQRPADARPRGGRLALAFALLAGLVFASGPAAAGHHESGGAAHGKAGAAQSEGGAAESKAGAGRGKAASAAKAGGTAEPTPSKDAGAKADDRPKGLMAPHLAREKAPGKFRVRLETTRGEIVIEVNRSWSPNGADRFYNLVKVGYYDDVAFFRVIPGFMAQFGMHGDPAVSRKWQRATIEDDPVVESNLRGFVTFAKTGRPNSRTTQLFINLADNPNLDRQGFSPFGRVVEGMDVVDAIFPIGEGAPRGRGPNQQRIRTGGNDYLRTSFPRLDYIEKATIVE